MLGKRVQNQAVGFITKAATCSVNSPRRCWQATATCITHALKMERARESDTHTHSHKPGIIPRPKSLRLGFFPLISSAGWMNICLSFSLRLPVSSLWPSRLICIGRLRYSVNNEMWGEREHGVCGWWIILSGWSCTSVNVWLVVNGLLLDFEVGRF